jgi:hydrogenase expression/formation protein HypD
MPENVHLTTGPGCPVCVTAQEDIDAIVALALASVPIATYGDMMRVPSYAKATAKDNKATEGKPGRATSLDQAREQGAKIFSVYSVEEALVLQKKYPGLVFFGLGFETTAPMTAYAIKRGLTVYSTHKLFLPAMQALLKIGEIKIDGYICPGHVSTIIGTEPYKSMKVPQVITGFTANDILVGIYMLLKQIAENRAEVENEYLRSVKKEGNPKAMKEIFEVFDVADGNWRGFGIIPKSGLEIKKKYEKFNAKVKYKNILNKLQATSYKLQAACKCGEIIRGLKSPSQCPLFKKFCSPENPVGPCMVSSEGACNVGYKYSR